MNESKSIREEAERKSYAVFCRHYERLYGAALPSYDQLSSQSREVWNATAADLTNEKEQTT